MFINDSISVWLIEIIYQRMEYVCCIRNGRKKLNVLKRMCWYCSDCVLFVRPWVAGELVILYLQLHIKGARGDETRYQSAASPVPFLTPLGGRPHILLDVGVSL
jgi:hypothetical protein